MDNRPKILAVDDAPANLEILMEVLSTEDYLISTVTSGARALKLVNHHPPDLILLDIQMPGIDGFTTCEKLKANPETAAIPVIFMTALSDTDSKVKGFELGAIDYITKPFQEKELLARVRTHLQLSQWNKTLENRVAERTHELQAALNQLHQSQLQLVQNEKMSALGSLVAGVAHEINNPVGFIAGNLQPAQDYVQDLLSLLDLYQAKMPEADEEIEETIEAIDLDFLREDLLKLIASMQEGIDRIRHISTSLRTFSRTDKEHKVPFNLHEGLDSTLLILKHRLKANDTRPAIKIIKDYGNLPEVQCFPGQLNQVFMNLIANSIDALEESNQGRSFEEISAHPNQITIATEMTPEQVIVRIADNGIGMSQAVKQRIFEQGFTTKGVGRGTGLGLAIARQIVVDKHEGYLKVQSQIGQGTEFLICLPL